MKRTHLSFKQRIGRALAAHRRAMNVTQEKFAVLAGKHRVDYWRIENGKINIQIETLEKLCQTLEVETWQVVKEADDMAKYPAHERNETASASRSRSK